MCVNPIRIKNPKMKTGTFSNNLHQYYLEVPCGHCYECLLQKQQEWIVRNYYHYKYINYIGGCSYFYTLTFNNANIMHWPSFSTLYNHETLMFDPVKLKLFLKRLNARLARRGIDLSYYLVSELGSKTERPHHHVIFYLSKYISPSEFYRLVDECWHYGFVKPGQNFGLVNSPAAIFYCCKYISKYGKKKKISSLQPVPSYRRLASYLNRHFGCFSRVSSGLGWNRFVKLNKDDFVNGFVNIPFEGKYKSFPIPLYYKRKLLCESFVNPNGNISYRPNQFGWSIMEKQFYLMYDNLQTKCEVLNQIYGTDFSADEILHYRLRNSLPFRMLKHSDCDLYMQSKINNGYVTREFPHIDDRYYISRDDIQRKLLYNKFNQFNSYRNYEQRACSYNVNQRVCYGVKKHEVELLKFSDYVNSSA